MIALEPIMNNLALIHNILKKVNRKYQYWRMNLFHQSQSSYKIVKVLIASILILYMCRIYKQIGYYEEIKTVTVFDSKDVVKEDHNCVNTKSLHKGFHSILQDQFILKLFHQGYRQ